MSFYLLGTGGPGVAVLPPVEGIFFDNITYYYSGNAKAKRQFQVGGNVVAGLDATTVADFPTVAWVPSTNVLGGTLMFAATAFVGNSNVHVDAVVTGPRGGQIDISTKDNKFIVADPVLSASLGWKLPDDLFLAATTQVSVPVGHYRDGAIANLAFHRWIVDTSLALSWHDTKVGWDVSAKTGLTFNGTNHATDYNTGTEFHFEGAVERSFSKAFSAGLQGYYFRQVSGDSGAGATLGPFKGRVTALGATAASNFNLGKAPATLRFRIFEEFDVKNRVQGTAAFVELNFPISMKLPHAAAH